MALTDMLDESEAGLLLCWCELVGVVSCGLDMFDRDGEQIWIDAVIPPDIVKAIANAVARGATFARDIAVGVWRIILAITLSDHGLLIDDVRG